MTSKADVTASFKARRLADVPEGFACEVVLDRQVVRVVVTWLRCGLKVTWVNRIVDGSAAESLTEQLPCSTPVVKVLGPYKPGLF